MKIIMLLICPILSLSSFAISADEIEARSAKVYVERIRCEETYQLSNPYKNVSFSISYPDEAYNKEIFRNIELIGQTPCNEQSLKYINSQSNHSFGYLLAIVEVTNLGTEDQGIKVTIYAGKEKIEFIGEKIQ